MKRTLILTLLFLTLPALACGPRDPAQRRAFMHLHPCPVTGKAYGACHGYVVDHVIPLCKGGPDRPANMQWSTIAEGKRKDRCECTPKGC